MVRLKLWNRDRLRRDRIRRLLRDDPFNRSSVPRPNCVKRLLFLEAQEGWGDFLYFLGLLQELHKAGVEIDVASLPSTYKRYEGIPFIRQAYSLGAESDRRKIAANQYDEAIDVTYVNANYWDLRRPVLAGLKCHTITVSDIARNSIIFDEFVDLGVRSHWQDRNAILFDAILHPDNHSKPIPPIYFSPTQAPAAEKFIATWDKKAHVYINTEGRVAERTLTMEQVEALVNVFNVRKTSVGVFYTKHQISESEWVKILPKMPFSDCTCVVQQCKAIITPDTSIVHLGSVFDIPVLGIYCGNNRDYWPQYAMQDVWAPLSIGSRIFVEDDVGVTKTSDFVYMHRKRPVSCYSPIKIAKVAEDFLLSLRL